MNSDPSCSNCPSTWKKILAFFIDYFSSFFIFGYIIAYFFEGLTKNGFELEGVPALVVFSLIIAYFIIMKRYFSGTLGEKILGIVPSKH